MFEFVKWSHFCLMKSNTVKGIYRSLQSNKREIADLNESHCSPLLVRKLERLPSYTEYDNYMMTRIDELESYASSLNKLSKVDLFPQTKEDFYELLDRIESSLNTDHEFKQTTTRKYEEELEKTKSEQKSGYQKIFLKSKSNGMNQDNSMKNNFEILTAILDEAFGLN